ncbi:MAG TPA: hypothetical protein VGH20_20350 [Myxococcales bacterium]
MTDSTPPPRRFDWLRRFFLPVAPGLSGHASATTKPWYLVLWLTGVDYFSTLGYQPGIAFLAAGALSPVATVVLVLVTLVGVLPVYAQVAKRSHAGQGSVAMLERLIPGWPGKLFVLALLGFATTDFVITMTLSAADAAQHVVENPILAPFVHSRILVTCLLLAALAAVFLRGFGEAIAVAAAVAIPYLALNAVVIVRGFIEVAEHPATFERWREALQMHGDTGALLVAAVLVFPRLALGLSGFETGVSVMPLIRDEGHEAAGRIRGARLLLLTAAVLMSVLLLGSSFVTTLLIPAHEFAPGGKASGRALAFVAHALMGETFGSVYDLSTIVILWFAGASAMAGLLNLLPRYLPRFGMAPQWAQHVRPLVLVLFAADLIVTWIFHADVDAQGGAYATGVLALLLSAAIAVVIALWREKKHARAVLFGSIAAMLGYTFVDNVITRPEGVAISAVFIALMIFLSALSRYRRATELRVEKVEFEDGVSQLLWFAMKDKQVNLVPLRHTDKRGRRDKADRLRKHYRVKGAIVFLHVDLADDTSEFQSVLRARLAEEDGDFVIEMRGAVAIANAIAWVSEQLDPIGIFLELSHENPFVQALRYMLWGEGEIGLLVYQILQRHWRSTGEHVRPQIFLFSE